MIVFHGIRGNLVVFIKLCRREVQELRAMLKSGQRNYAHASPHTQIFYAQV